MMLTCFAQIETDFLFCKNVIDDYNLLLFTGVPINEDMCHC